MEWRPPNESEWNGILRGYQLRYTRVDSTTTLPPSTNTWWGVNIPQANLTQYSLHGLQPSSLYCVQVAAMTVATGPYSHQVCATTPEGMIPTLSSGMSTVTTVVPTPANISGSQRSSFVAIVVGLVVATVIILQAALVVTVIVAVCRWKRMQKSRRYGKYYLLSRNYMLNFFVSFGAVYLTTMLVPTPMKCPQTHPGTRIRHTPRHSTLTLTTQPF